MTNQFVRQAQIFTQGEIRAGVNVDQVAFFDADGNPLDLAGAQLTKAAHVAPVAAANATDLASAQTLTNANKVAINAVIASLIASGQMSAT